MTGRKEISNYHLKNWMIRVNYEGFDEMRQTL